jgi:hypothetical protein
MARSLRHTCYYVTLGALASATLALTTLPFCWRLPKSSLPRTRCNSESVLFLLWTLVWLTARCAQILLHPYVHAKQAPLLAYSAAQGIVSEAYSALTYVRPTFRLTSPILLIHNKLRNQPNYAPAWGPSGRTSKRDCSSAQCHSRSGLTSMGQG